MAEYEAVTEQLMRRVYLGLREDNLDPQDVVALACDLLDWFHCTDAVLEVVERNPAEVPRAEMTSLARRVLDDVGFDPGFDLAPERLETLRAALRIVARDLLTRGIEGEPEIEILEDWFPVGAGVRLADGERLNWGGPVLPSMCDDPATALTSLTIMIQESLLEWTWQVWPVCPRHHLGVHGSERDGAAVWWCAGDGGHILAPVGELARALGRRRPG
ncbi:hypothetical protein [Streptomyces sp. NBC_00582]|uniref:hypothetical protein n=1 Tax=Streptomyces sp. NBC_00582 TaxID=2975783 RepID=UPI001063ED3B|nr:hypothetical protein [Streptomyces sp. NBC_00582]WUB59037.1 hypothetical protein OG852_00515 [Streptomyces sp. NBC_00582]WUB67691.1 hypothetical protein OG852_48620 [Streptomyces sp. NBC_00582]